MKKVLKWTMIVIGGLIVIGLFLPEDKNAATAQAEPSAAAAQAAPALQVSAGELFRDYEANEVAADQKYKAKRLEVAGTVAGISKNAFDDIYVEIATSNEFSSIHAQGIPEQIAASLQKGQPITVNCVGAGLMIGSPMLDECSVL